MPQNRGDVHDPVFEIRDPVYGFVKLTGAEIDIINTPTFQRLRDIRQLAMGHMVYPGANHTRFEHSIGCVHVSTEVLELLKEREGKGGRPTFLEAFSADDHAYDRGKKILRLASLLHDIGHPPFSHSGEGLLPNGVSHEEMSVRLIRETEIATCIEMHYDSAGIKVEDVIAVATKPSLAKSVDFQKPWNFFLNQILTAELGSDRIDYLLRDAHHSGQMGGKFDYVKLLNAMTVLQQPECDGEAWVLGLDAGGWLVAEQMVVARYMMYVSLYFHKTKRIYEIHLEDFMREYLRKNCLPANLKKYIALTDSKILAAINEAASNKSKKGHAHARRFMDRSHLRMAREVVLADNFSVGDDGRRYWNKNRFDNLVEHVRVTYGYDPMQVDTPTRAATDMFSPDTKILVLLDGKVRNLDDLSEIVRGMSSKIWRGRLYCEKEHEVALREGCNSYLEANPVREATDIDPSVD